MVNSEDDDVSIIDNKDDRPTKKKKDDEDELKFLGKKQRPRAASAKSPFGEKSFSFNNKPKGSGAAVGTSQKPSAGKGGSSSKDSAEKSSKASKKRPAATKDNSPGNEVEPPRKRQKDVKGAGKHSFNAKTGAGKAKHQAGTLKKPDAAIQMQKRRKQEKLRRRREQQEQEESSSLDSTDSDASSDDERPTPHGLDERHPFNWRCRKGGCIYPICPRCCYHGKYPVENSGEEDFDDVD